MGIRVIHSARGNDVIIGAQYGDEGKGKVVDVLARRVHNVVRYQGGSNAGHTLVVDGKRVVVHLVPSGVLHPHVTNVIGCGVVVDPVGLSNELDYLQNEGVFATGRIYVSERAHMVLPTHKRLDAVREVRRGKKKLGTTGRGIGPCYEGQASRSGIRCGEVRDEKRFIARVREHVSEMNLIIVALGGDALDVESVLEELLPAARRMAPMVMDTVAYLQNEHRQGRTLLFEGAQGTMLDRSFGTYPFVTSSNTTVGGVCTGTGLGYRAVNRVICVAKAYTTRVGAGPFPVELFDEMGELLREKGDEYGATTGRPRRCGWLDLVVVRYACDVNDADLLNLTKLDVLSGVGSLKVCIGYMLDGELIDTVPSDATSYARAEPVYKELPGWEEDITECSSFFDLPQAAQEYIQFVEEFTGVPVGPVGVGPGRKQMIQGLEY